MKKFVLFISMIFCVSLLVSCANMLEGLTNKNETDNTLVPSGEYKPEASKNSDKIAIVKNDVFTYPGKNYTFKRDSDGKNTVSITSNGALLENTTWDYSDGVLSIIRWSVVSNKPFSVDKYYKIV